MCKHCVVGVGAAEATLRLPPSGYREKIWDHVAGEHFVREAGGRVTDLRGRALSFERVRRAGEGENCASFLFQYSEDLWLCALSALSITDLVSQIALQYIGLTRGALT
jgi:3'-phosphoadenosine 5'-phosphosulfate (PAPS) 3'-phosphatase